MARWTYLMLTALAATPALAEPAPLCSRPEVLQEVARIVRGWNVYNTVVETSVVEFPTTRPNAVACQATIEGTTYVDTPSGVQTRRVGQPRRYDVQVSGNRFAVQVSP